MDRGRPAMRVAVRDAASLVLVDDSGPQPRFLMGRRPGSHVFMAGVTVFPGGRLEREDLALASRFTLSPAVQARLAGGTHARFQPRRAVALALAAIREGYEETGIMLGRRGAFAAPSPAWLPFEAAGVIPAPDLLTPVARAITPTRQTRRFDARFFAVRASRLASGAAEPDPPTDELERVGWLRADQLAHEPLAEITQLILSEIMDRLAAGTLFDPSCPMPVHRRRKNGFHSILV